jgi:hypothetical protein
MDEAVKLTLTRTERKERLGHGGIREIAKIAGVSDSFVSHVLAGRKRNARIEALITGRIAKPGETVFPSAGEASQSKAA